MAEYTRRRASLGWTTKALQMFALVVEERRRRNRAARAARKRNRG